MKNSITISEERNLWKSLIHRLVWAFTHARRIRAHRNLRGERIMRHIREIRLRNSMKTL